MSLLVVDGILHFSGTVEFNSSMWAILALTVVGAVLADRMLHRLRSASEDARVRVPIGR